MRRWCRIAMSTLSMLTLVLGAATIMGCGKDEAQAIRQEETSDVSKALRSRGPAAQMREEEQEEQAQRQELENK